MSIAAFARTLDQELVALARGVAYECPCCGEFVLHRAGMITCPECNASLRAGNDIEMAQLQFDSQAG